MKAQNIGFSGKGGLPITSQILPHIFLAYILQPLGYIFGGHYEKSLSQ